MVERMLAVSACRGSVPTWGDSLFAAETAQCALFLLLSFGLFSALPLMTDLHSSIFVCVPPSPLCGFVCVSLPPLTTCTDCQKPNLSLTCRLRRGHKCGLSIRASNMSRHRPKCYTFACWTCEERFPTQKIKQEHSRTCTGRAPIEFELVLAAPAVAEPPVPVISEVVCRVSNTQLPRKHE